MTQPFRQWTVLPHGKLVQIDENILTVVGELHMPLMDLPRRMTVVRLRDARLVVFSAIALDEDEMSALEAYGRPAYLIVPSDKHRLDARTWKDRCPEMQVVAPVGARAKVEEVVAVDTVAPQFDDPNVQFVTTAGTRGRKAARRGRGAELSAAKGTAWGLLCAMTEFVDHERRARNAEYRLDRAWFGQGAGLKRRALDLALQLAS